MAVYPKDPSFLQRLARLEGRVATLERARPPAPDEVPFYPTHLETMAYSDATSYATLWETIITTRTANLSIGLVLIGDFTNSVSTGGDWRLIFGDGTDIAASGSVPPTGAYTFPAHTISLASYEPQTALKLRIQTRRTAGSTTGGKFGGGGSIGCAPRYARLI